MAQFGKSTQDFVPITDIRDGVVVLKDGSLRMVLIVSSLNFALKSQDEQTAILLQFQNFLNSLDFSIQMFIQSKKLDISPYLELLQGRVTTQQNELLRIQTREYIQFIENFVSSVNIMSKSFFVVIPYTSPIIDAKTGIFGKLFKKNQEVSVQEERFEETKTQLEQRLIIVEQGLHTIGLRSARLGTEELIELYYKTFNPGEKSAAPGGDPAVKPQPA